MVDAAKIKEDVEKALGYKTEFWFGFDNQNRLCFSKHPNNYNDNIMNTHGFHTGIGAEKDYLKCIDQIANRIKTIT
ncbi:hypothetical protein [Flavobacterium sp.]|uniref:hypothetical protein n=1 Tax=Flavobacterium sp. TaxID=239 RepID=UPI003D6AA138